MMLVVEKEIREGLLVDDVCEQCDIAKQTSGHTYSA